jgi:hypothetical protein
MQFKIKLSYLAVCHRVGITDFKEFHRFFFLLVVLVTFLLL